MLLVVVGLSIDSGSGYRLSLSLYSLCFFVCVFIEGGTEGEGLSAALLLLRVSLVLQEEKTNVIIFYKHTLMLRNPFLS